MTLLVKNLPASAGDVRDLDSRLGFDSWVWKVPWRRECQPTPVFLPGEFPWTEEPGRLQFIGLQRVGHQWSNLECTHSPFIHEVSGKLGVH